MSASIFFEFISSRRTLTATEQDAMREEYPLMWGLYLGPPGWLHGDECAWATERALLGGNGIDFGGLA